MDATGNLYIKGTGQNSHEGMVIEDTVIPTYFDRENGRLSIGEGSDYICNITLTKKK